jgi:hypothetical protein
LSLKITHRNLINLALMAGLSAWAIFYFNPTKTQYVGLYLFLFVAPKALWSSFDYLTSVDLSKVVAWFRASNSSHPKEGRPEAELVS